VAEALKARERALDPDRCRKLLRELLEGSGWELIKVDRFRVLKEWPGRRLTIRYDVKLARDGGRPVRMPVFAKLYRGRRGERIHRLLGLLRPVLPAALHLPEPLGYSARRRALLLGPVDGPSLSSSLEEPSALALMALAGWGVAAWHGLRTPGLAELLPRHGPEEEIRVLERAWKEVSPGTAVSFEEKRGAGAARLPTDLVARARALILRVGEALRSGRGSEEALLHRDLHPEQILLPAGGVGLVDLDEVALGEAELDLGNLVAHLQLHDLQRQGRIRHAPSLALSLLASYRNAHPYDERRLVLYTVSSLLRLASLERLARPDRSVLGWPELAASLLHRAEELMA
jgi:hypothetical protein